MIRARLLGSLLLVAAHVGILSGVAVVSPRVASAAPPSKKDKDKDNPATALKKEGDAAMDDLRYGDALDAYRRAYEVSPEPALLYNQARASQALGDPVGASRSSIASRPTRLRR